VLGTLRTGEAYLGLGDDGAGHVAALLNPATSNFNPFASPCANGCPVQIIDVTSRTILQQTSTTISDLASAIRTRLDAACGDVVVGYTKQGMNVFGGTGYRVQSIGFAQGPTDAGAGGVPEGGIDGAAGGMGGMVANGGYHVDAVGF
jgi:hypothetical protein